MEKYELVRDVGSGNLGVARLMRNKVTKELVAMKFIERGDKIDNNVAREIIIHRSLKHPNIIRFKEVILTRTHLAIVMEYSSGGELFERICNNGKFSEDEARWERGTRVKICDFGLSKSSLLHSRPKTVVGTPQYVSPEVLSRREYDEKMTDIWSGGVILYVMLFGAYPFGNQEDPTNFRKIVQQIMSVQYKIPDYVHISQDCKNLLSRIFVAGADKRINLKEIKGHPWFLKNLPRELTEAAQAAYYKKELNPDFYLQSKEDIMKIMNKAKIPPPVARSIGGFRWEEEGEEELEEEGDEDEYDIRVKEAHQNGAVRVF